LLGWWKPDVQLWEAEGCGAHLEEPTKSVWAEARVTRQLPAPTADDLIRLVIELAEHALPLWERPSNHVDGVAIVDGELWPKTSSSVWADCAIRFARYAAQRRSVAYYGAEVARFAVHAAGPQEEAWQDEHMLALIAKGEGA
jgi:hypothetical protein